MTGRLHTCWKCEQVYLCNQDDCTGESNDLRACPWCVEDFRKSVQASAYAGLLDGQKFIERLRATL
jgi:hypothetical protein